MRCRGKNVLTSFVDDNAAPNARFDILHLPPGRGASPISSTLRGLAEADDITRHRRWHLVPFRMAKANLWSTSNTRETPAPESDSEQTCAPASLVAADAALGAPSLYPPPTCSGVFPRRAPPPRRPIAPAGLGPFGGPLGFLTLVLYSCAGRGFDVLVEATLLRSLTDANNTRETKKRYGRK